MRKFTSQAGFILLALTITAGSIFFSCSKDSGTTPVSKDAIKDSIAAVKMLLTNSTEGVASGQYQKGAKAELQTTIDAVQAIVDDPASTQTDIINATATLSQAVIKFKGKLIIPIAQENLVAQWTFSEGTGTIAHDASSHHLDGTLMAGHTAIATHGPLPTWSADRYGAASQALHFGDGGHIEVPFNSALNPGEITISVWVKADAIFENNYIISQNWWEGYKFQLQSVSKAFFTYKNNATPAAYADRDWVVNGVENNVWHHLVVTLKTGEEDFYYDGALVKSWTDVTGTIIHLANPQKFVIGQEQPNTLVGIAPADDPSQYGVGYFKGSLDDIRIYNKSLTGTQVLGIYNLEKVQ